MTRIPGDVDSAAGGAPMLPDSPVHQAPAEAGAAGAPAPAAGGEPQPTPDPDAAPGPAPDAGPTTPTAPGLPVSPFRDGLAQRGFDMSGFETDEAAYDWMQQQLNANAQLPELQQKAAYYEAQAAQRAPAEQAPPADKEPYWPQAPEWDPSWEKRIWVEKNEATGQNELRGDPGDIQKYRAYQNWQEGRRNALLQDPYACVKQPFEERLDDFRQQLHQDVAQFYQQQQVQQHFNSFVLQNQDRFYHTDDKGEVIYDPRSGQPVFTQDGLLFSQICDQLATSGTDLMQIPGFAMRQLDGMRTDPAATPAAPQTTFPQPGTQPGALPDAPTTAQQMKDNFVADGVAAAQRAANRGGSVAGAAQPHAPHMDADQDPKAMLEDAMTGAGLLTPRQQP